jgi:hypothetical protein
MTWPVSPWRRALSEERCLPAGVRGPVECWELARLISARWSGAGSLMDGALDSCAPLLLVEMESDIGLAFCYRGTMVAGAADWGRAGNC